MLLETKLHPPRPKSNLLARESLACLIHRHLDKRLIAVISGAGYGKTTLMGQILEREQLPAMYLSLDPADSDSIRFCQYLVAGLSRLTGSPKRSTIDQSLGAALRQLREDDSLARRPNDFATALINTLAGHHAGDLYIVLDDYHWLDRESPVHALLDYFIDRMPSFVHVMICSRSPLPLPSLPKWRAKQDAFELEQSDLAFKEPELRELMSLAYRAVLPETELHRVLEQTQGWITGIHLIMQAAGMHKSVKETLNGYVAANRPLFEYFASEILAKEDRPVQDFMIQTSLLETLTGPACDHLLERKGSAALLRDLAGRNIFLTETARGQYRHHPLFRNFLGDRLTDPELAHTLQTRAGEFCRKSGLAEQAVEHFLQAGRPEQAAPLIVDLHDQYVGGARFEALGRWFSQLPEEMFDKYPQLLLPLSRWQLEQRRPEEQRQSLQRAATLLEKSGDRGHLCRVLLSLGQTLISDRRLDEAVGTISRGIRLCPPSLAQLRAELYNTCGQAWLWKGRYDRAGNYYRRALKIAQSARLPFEGQVKIMVDLCVLHSRLGDYRTAYQNYRTLISRIKPDYYYLGIGSLYGSAAKAALTVGDPPAAEAFLARGDAVCRQHQDIRSLAALSIIGAQLDFLSKRWEKAERTLSQLAISCESLGSRDYLEAVQRNLAQLCRYRGRTAEAWLMLEPFRESFERPPENYLVLRGLSEKGYLEASEGKKDEAKKTASSIAQAARHLNDRLGTYYAEMILSLACSDRPAEARKHLSRATAMAKRWGYEGLLALEVGNNPALNRLYREAKGSRIVDRLLGPGSNIVSEPSDQKVLSVRLFGSVEFTGPSGRPVAVTWKMRRVGALFAYLAVNRGRLCQVEELLDAFWPTLGAAQAKAKLYQIVCLLRDDLRTALASVGIALEAAGELVVHQSQGYRLAPDLELSLDVEIYDKLWKEHIQMAGPGDPALAEHCRQALALYGNGFLPGAGDPWSEAQREQYYKKYLMIKEKLARNLAAAGQPQAAAVLYEEYLAQEPFAEQVRLEYWKALLAAGNRQRISENHLKYARLLRKELGQPPGAELTAFLRTLG